jgi:ketosteroid isomerase-like protein
MKRTCRYLILACLSFVIGCASSDRTGLSAHDQKLLNTLRDMRAAHNRHDLEAELSYYADDARFEVVGMRGFVVVGKEELRRLFIRDVQNKSQLGGPDTLDTDGKVEVQGETVIIHGGQERNKRFTEMGLGAIYYDEKRITFRNGLIQETILVMSDQSIEAIRMRAFQIFRLGLTMFAHNRHDLEQELSFYTDDVRFEVVGTGGFTKEGKEELRKFLERDILLNSQLIFTITDCKLQGDTVICPLKEQNELVTRLGLDAIYYEECRHTFRDGLIKEVKATISPASDEACKRQVNAFSEWVAENRPDEIETLKILQPEQAAPADITRLLNLLEQWQKVIKDKSAQETLKLPS